MIFNQHQQPCRYPKCACAGNYCVKAAVSGGVLQALEYAARRALDYYAGEIDDLLDGVNNDAQAAEFGARLSYIADLCGWSIRRTRGHLLRHMAAGLVHMHQSRPHSIAFFWPTGLLGEIKLERAAEAANHMRGIAA